MKSISTQLKAALDSGNICYLFSISARDGTTRLFTDTNTSLTVDSKTYTPSAGVTRLKMKTTNNAEVSNHEVMATVLDMPDGELKSGKWDGAAIEVSIASWENPSAGKLVIFKGSIGVIQWTDEGFRADIQNYLRDLGKNIGETVTGNCRHQLFSTATPGRIGACGVSRAANVITGSVTTILSQRVKFKIASTTKETGWATAGFLKFTSGNNAGLTYEVKRHLVEAGALGESIELFLPSLTQITVGTTFELTAGCDHTFETCKSKFNNVQNFGGFPHLEVDVNARLEKG